VGVETSSTVGSTRYSGEHCAIPHPYDKSTKFITSLYELYALFDFETEQLS